LLLQGNERSCLGVARQPKVRIVRVRNVLVGLTDFDGGAFQG